MSDSSVSATRVVPATPEQIFDLLADPRKHPIFDGSGTVKEAVTGPDRLSEGATFSMKMHAGMPYRIKNRVVEFEENARIAWRHVGRHRWRYELEPVDGGTRVTETFDWSPVPPLINVFAKSQASKNQQSMEKTLERLEDHFSSS